MNRESFEKLPEEKKTIIEEAYFAVFNKEIAPGNFFTICRETLTDAEYAALFDKHSAAGAAQHAQTASPREHQPQQEEIKTEHIEDIMQYSGIDLKEEAENIVKDAEYHVSMSTYDDVDKNGQMDSLFNVAAFRNFLGRICGARGMKITEEGMKLLFQVVKRKILDFVDKMDEACQIRTETGLSDFSFQIDNEVAKQLWYLNELEKAKMEKLVIKKDEDQKKKKIVQEREDLLVKKKQSNTVAMAAMGVKRRAWMSSDSSKMNEESHRFNSIYSPFDEKAFDDKIRGRTITMKDMLYVLERDKRYNKSIFLIQHYFK